MDSKKVSLKYGLILGGAVIIYSAIINQLGLSTDQTVTSLSYLILPIVLYMAIKKNQQVSENYSFGAGFGTGFKVTAIASLIVAVFTYVYFAFIDPDMVQFILEQTENKMYAQDNMSEDQIEMAIEMQKKFMTPGMMAFWGGIAYLFIGTILALIIAAITKKSDNESVQ